MEDLKSFLDENKNRESFVSRCVINLKNTQDKDISFWASRIPKDKISNLICMHGSCIHGTPVEYQDGKYLVATSKIDFRGYLPCTYQYRVDEGSESEYKNGIIDMGRDIYLIPNEPLPENAYIWIYVGGIVEEVLI